QWVDSSGVWSSSSALWCAPVEARLHEPFVQCTPTLEGFELSANTYVPLVQLTANVPGHWSNNGMALEPGQGCVVQFTPETPMAPADIHVVVRCQATVPQ
ncbi:MAG: hypothetical protein QF427_04695, partial [Flavobacteriales bacterium]|nr:hypothetical protein [Flavobacteriales bacterium]